MSSARRVQKRILLFASIISYGWGLKGLRVKNITVADAVLHAREQKTGLEEVWYLWDDAHIAYFDYREESSRRRLSDYKNDYKKPSEQDSSRDCFRVAQRIRKSFIVDDDGSRRGCMACNPTIGAPDELCPKPETSAYDCQTLVNELYRKCRGKKNAWPLPDEKPKTMPDGYFFDPEEKFSGTWSRSIEKALKIEIERCGCDFAFLASAPSWLFFSLAFFLVSAILM